MHFLEWKYLHFKSFFIELCLYYKDLIVFLNDDICILCHFSLKYVYKDLIDERINIGSGYDLVPSGTKP